MKRKDKSQVAVLALWAVVFLSILAVSLGQRLALVVRLNRFQKNSLKSRYLAKAGLVKAVAILLQDNPEVDNFKETWCTGKDEKMKDVLKDVELISGSQEAFSVGLDQTCCLQDEKSRLNINKLEKSELEKLLAFRINSVSLNTEELKKMAELICVWRGDNISMQGQYPYFFKRASFTVAEELIAVFEYFFREVQKVPNYQNKARAIYSDIKDVITVYSEDNKVNLNTVLPEVLEFLFRSVSVNPAASEEDIAGLVNAFAVFRDNGCYFEHGEAADISSAFLKCTNYSLNQNQQALLNAITERISISSSTFRIHSTGKVGGIIKGIHAIFRRQVSNVRLLFWHQD